MPELDVLMAVKDGARHLPRALEMLLAQTFRNFRLIVVDDGSTDETPDILARAAARDGRVSILTNPRNLRLPASLNRGLALCEAPLTARADADDEYHPERLARQVAALRARPEVGVLSCGFERIDDAGRILGRARAMTGPARLRFEMMFRNRLLHSGAMFRTALVRAAGGYDECYWTAQDSDLWDRLGRITALDNLPEPLVRYRVSLGSIMRGRGAEGERLSLSVPQRQLSAYLGHELTFDETAAVCGLYGGRSFQDATSLATARTILREIAALAREREPRPIARRFEGELLRSIARQAFYRLPRNPRTAVRILAGPPEAAWRGSGRSGQSPRLEDVGDGAGSP